MPKRCKRIMDKRKTSIVVAEDTWKEWTFFVIQKTGTSRKLSLELENAIKEYMANHEETDDAKS